MTQLAIAIEGLTKLDAAELQRAVPPGALSSETDTHRARHGEAMLTTAVVVVSIAALKALSVWLAKTRKRGSLERVVEIRSPDGTVRREELRIEGSEEEISAQALKQLAALTDVDLSVLPTDT